MKIVMSRVDERLVHGQVIASWAKILSIRSIIIVDDQLATDSFMSSVLSMAAPSGVTVEIVPVAKIAERIFGDDGAPINTMLLFKSVKYALDLVEQGVELKELNIGNIGAGPSRKAICKNVFISPIEAEIIRSLVEKGVYVYLQMIHTESKTDILNKM